MPLCATVRGTGMEKGEVVYSASVPFELLFPWFCAESLWSAHLSSVLCRLLVGWVIDAHLAACVGSDQILFIASSSFF